MVQTIMLCISKTMVNPYNTYPTYNTYTPYKTYKTIKTSTICEKSESATTFKCRGK